MPKASAILVNALVDGPAALVRAISLTTLAIAELLFKLIRSEIGSDIHDIRQSLLHKIKAEGETAAADATKRVAEALEAVNRATFLKRSNSIARAERAVHEAEAKTVLIDLDATLIDSSEIRRQRQADMMRLIEAEMYLIKVVAKLRQEGFDVSFDRETLEKMLEACSPPQQERQSAPVHKEEAEPEQT